jgi:hypothetical protein
MWLQSVVQSVRLVLRREDEGGVVVAEEKVSM